MIDEVRHSTIQMNLKRLYMNHYIDPAGFDITEKAFSNCYAGTIGRQFGEGFITGDAITAANVYLTIVAETAFTNVLFVAMPGEAAANGDYLLPTVFHSVQSDESRHISNGYSIILMALADERNRELLERDLRYAWWNNHAVVDAAIGTFIEYGTKDRRKDRDSYAESWRRWIYDDYYRSYLVPLEKYGLTIPHDLVEEAWDRIWNKGYVHEVAQFFATGWFANYWRIDAMDDTDFEWFEHKYPGWYDKYGKWWERYADLSKKNGHKPIAFEPGLSDYEYPHRCWSCMVPCLIREDMVVDEVDGQVRTYCSETCHWTDAVAFRPEYNGRPTPSMGKLSGKREWETLYHGMDVAEIMQDLGLRPRRRQHAGPAAAPGSRPQEDVDARRGPRRSRSTAPTCCSTRCPPRSATRTSPTTRPAAPPAGPPRTAPPPDLLRRRGTPRTDPAAVPPRWRRRTHTMGEKHIARFEPVGIEIEVDEDETILDAAFRQGRHAHARLQGGAVRGLQVVPARRRGRPRSLLDVRPARLRGAGGLHAAVPGARAVATSRSSSSTTTRRSCAAACRSSTATAEVEAVEPLTHDIRRLVLRLRDPESLTFHAGPVHGHRDPRRRRRAPVVLDGQHARASPTASSS